MTNDTATTDIQPFFARFLERDVDTDAPTKIFTGNKRRDDLMAD